MNAKVQVVMRGMGGIGTWSKHRGEIAAGRETQGRQELTIRIAFVGHRRNFNLPLIGQAETRMSTALPVACSLNFASWKVSPLRVRQT